MTTQCWSCGAPYEVRYVATPVRVVDSFNCQLCRRELSSWLGFRAPRYRLLLQLSRGEEDFRESVADIEPHETQRVR